MRDNKQIAYGRIGLLGNPSDMFGGRTLSLAIGNHSWVEIKTSMEFSINKGDIGNHVDHDLIYSKDKEDKQENGFENNDLVKATIRHLNLEDRVLRKEIITILYDSDIPIGSGLSGSSAIIIATINALNKHYNLGIDDKRKIAELALHVETDELGISAGFQDRYLISHAENNRAVIYMDFTGKELLRKAPEIDPYGNVEILNVPYIPCFISGGAQPKSSARTHNKFRGLFLKGYRPDATSEDKKITRAIKSEFDRIASLADYGKEAILRQEWDEVGRLMNINTNLREDLKKFTGNATNHLKKDMDMIYDALNYGAVGAKVAGSGGAIVVLTRQENFEAIFRKMRRKYLSMTLPISERK